MKISNRSFYLLMLFAFFPIILGNESFFGSIGLGSVYKILYYLIPIAYFGSFVKDLYDNKYKIKFDLFTILIILFVLSIMVSWIFGVLHTFSNITNLIYMFYMIGILYTIHIYKFEKKDFNTFIKYGTYIFILVCSLGILQYIFKINLIKNGIGKYPGAIGRITSTLATSTHLDKYVIVNLLFIIYYYFLGKYDDKKKKIIFLIASITGTISLALTYSRTGIICYYLLLFVFMICLTIKKKMLKFVYLLILMIILYLVPGQRYIISSTAEYAREKTISVLKSANMKFLIKPINRISDIFIIGSIDDSAGLEDDKTSNDDNKENNNEKPDNDKENNSQKPNNDKENNSQKPNNDKDNNSEKPNNDKENNKKPEIQKPDIPDYSVDSREEFDDLAKAFIKEYGLTGLGIGNYNYILKTNKINYYIDYPDALKKEYRYSHNMMLYMSADTGILSAIIFIAIYIYIFIAALKTDYKLIKIIALLTFIVLSLFEPLIYMRDIAPLFILIFILIKKNYETTS